MLTISLPYNKAEQVLLEQLARTEEEKAAKLKEATKNRTAIKAKREEIDHSLFKVRVIPLGRIPSKLS